MLSKNDLRELVLKRLRPSDKADLVVLVDTQLKPQGAKVRVGIHEVAMPAEGFYVYADLQPKANWGHPVAYFLVDAQSGKLVQINEQFPPFDGDPPANFRTLFDSREK